MCIILISYTSAQCESNGCTNIRYVNDCSLCETLLDACDNVELSGWNYEDEGC